MFLDLKTKVKILPSFLNFTELWCPHQVSEISLKPPILQLLTLNEAVGSTINTQLTKYPAQNR